MALWLLIDSVRFDGSMMAVFLFVGVSLFTEVCFLQFGFSDFRSDITQQSETEMATTTSNPIQPYHQKHYEPPQQQQHQHQHQQQHQHQHQHQQLQVAAAVPETKRFLKSGNVAKYRVGQLVPEGPNAGWLVVSAIADYGNAGPGAVTLELPADLRMSNGDLQSTSVAAPQNAKMAAAAPSERSKFCKQCGAASTGSRFCGECGASD
jgi:hypothetical protein